MKKETFDLLLSNVDTKYDELVKAVAVKPKKGDTKYVNPLTPLEEYEVANHPVFDKTLRKDKEIGQGDNKVPKAVNRIGLAMEPMIAGRAAAFLCANPIQYQAQPQTPAEERLWAAFKKVNEAGKLDFKNMGILETRMSQLAVAEIWYLDDTTEDDDYWSGTDLLGKAKQKPRLFLAQPSLGDELFPVWNGQENLMAIGRSYKELNEEGKEVEHFDLYTAENIYEGMKGANGWEVTKVANEIGKIPVIYHSQAETEWARVVTIIRRLEDIFSNFGDSNDRTAFPMLLLEGAPKSLPQGIGDKALQMDAGGKASYLVPPNAPEAIKTEVENLLRQLYTLTDTPDISFDNLKGLGTTSGFALQMMFMGAHLKAAKHAGTFGECVQRRVNLIKRLLITIDPGLKEGVSLAIKPTFDFYMPKDIEGVVDYLTTAATGGIISKETAVTTLQGVMGGDGATEVERVKGEKKSPGALDDLNNE